MMTPRIHIRDAASGEVRFDYYFQAGLGRRESAERILFVVRSRMVLWGAGIEALRIARRVGIRLPEGGNRECVIACPMLESRSGEILGDEPSLPVIVFSFPRSMSPHAALQTYEQELRKIDHIPHIELLTAFLVIAIHAVRRKKRPPLNVAETYAEVAAAWTEMGILIPHPPPVKYLKSSELDALAEKFAKAFFAGAISDDPEDGLAALIESTFTSLQSVSDMAYFCHALGEVLGSERFARWFALHIEAAHPGMGTAVALHNITGQFVLGHLGLAALEKASRSEFRYVINYRGRGYEVKGKALLWEQFLELALLSDRGLYAFTRGHEFPGNELTIERAWKTLAGDSFAPSDAPAIPWDESKPWADALLADAQENAAYTPSGFYRIVLPENSLLRPWGVSSISLWVEEGIDHIWVGLVSGKALGAVFRWQPEYNYPFSPLMVPTNIAGFVHLHIAALWRDLRVVGKEVFVDERTFRSQREAWGDTGEGQRKHRKARKMPRTRVSRAKYWGSYAVQKRIERAAHRIDGHKRRLPEGRKASQAARSLAREHFLLLPEDGRVTYVRPHIKGKDKTIDIFPETERPVDALGLATLMTFNDLHKTAGRECCD